MFDDNGIVNFDIIGISYYPNYSPETDLDELGSMIGRLRNTYQKEVMIFETGFVWKINGWIDNYNNILNHNGNVLEYPATPDGQLNYLHDLAQTVLDNNGSGVFYWEPAYISSDMCTKWGQGSPYENVCFFDYREDNTALPAFDFFGFCETQTVATPENNSSMVFPNPVLDGTITFHSKQPIKKWELYDMTGELIQSRELYPPVSNYTMHLSGLTQGVYMLKMTNLNNVMEVNKIELIRNTK